MKRFILQNDIGRLVSSCLLIMICFAPVLGQNSVSNAKHVLKIVDGLRSPLRIAFDQQDNAFVTDAIGSKILQYDQNGTLLGEILVGGSLQGITVTSQDLLYVGERLSGEIRLLDKTGQLLKTIAADVELPLSAALDNDNRLYFVDAENRAIKVFDTKTNGFVGSFGKGILGFPTGIAFDSKNQRILVAEHGGLVFSDSIAAPGMIHVFNNNGDLLTNIGKYGHDSGEFTRIQGLAVDFDGRIYAADPFQAVITVLDEDGTFLTTIGEFGEDLGQLRAPMDVAIDSRNRLWVASMNNSSLEVFDIGDIPTDVVVNDAPVIAVSSDLLQNY
ncbi:MAG: NHL repeat-containing protein, partial [bacterium]